MNNLACVPCKLYHRLHEKTVLPFVFIQFHVVGCSVAVNVVIILEQKYTVVYDLINAQLKPTENIKCISILQVIFCLNSKG